MTKTEFLAALKIRLSRLPDYERSRTLSFYAEAIEDRMEEGMSEEAAVSSLGSIDRIVSEILIDTPLTALIQSKLKEKRQNAKHQSLWFVLAILGSPIWLPLALGFSCVVFALYITVWALVISLFALEFSLALTGTLGLIASVIVCFRSLPAGLALLGISLVAAGLFFLSIQPMLWLCRQLLSLTGVGLRKLKTRFLAKKAVVL